MLPLTITAAAAERISVLLEQAPQDTIGLRIGIKTRGCSGFSYSIEYAHEPKQFEQVIKDYGICVFIDPAATMFLIGSEMDYVEGTFETGFIFRNPNEKGRCGCGESFHI